MPHKLTIAISTAFLVAAAASVAGAAGAYASTAKAVATICSELPLPSRADHCGAGSHCQYLSISDRSVGPTFPTACRQTT
jgi:hypothetical protein